jgi:integrase
MGRKGWYPVLSLPGNRKKWLRRCLTKREAEKLITQEVAKYQSSGWYPSASVLFRDFADRWLRGCVDGGRKPSTVQRISVGLTGALASRVWMLPAGPHHARGRPVFCQKHLRAGMSPATLSRLVRQMHTILEQARRWRYLSENPVAIVERPRVPKRPMDYLHPDEIGPFLDAAPPDRRLLFKTAILTGLRMGELLAMKWEHLDWRSGRYHVVESLWRGKGGFSFVTPKTETSRRAVRLPSGLLDELRNHQKLEDGLRASSGERYTDLGLIFCQPSGRPLDGRNLLQRDFWGTLRRAGLRRIRFHDLRHTFAALLIAEGAHAKAIQEAMGHSSIVVTMNTYGHLLPRLLEEVADRLERSLFPRADGRQAVDENSEHVGNVGLRALKIMVPGDGLEPPTRGFSVPCSTT